VCATCCPQLSLTEVLTERGTWRAPRCRPGQEPIKRWAHTDKVTEVARLHELLSRRVPMRRDCTNAPPLHVQTHTRILTRKWCMRTTSCCLQLSLTEVLTEEGTQRAPRCRLSQEPPLEREPTPQCRSPGGDSALREGTSHKRGDRSWNSPRSTRDTHEPPLPRQDRCHGRMFLVHVQH